LSLESILRYLLLKQMLDPSYRKLAFHLCDLLTYLCFVRLKDGQTPSQASLQNTVPRLRPDTIEKINILLIDQ